MADRIRVSEAEIDACIAQYKNSLEILQDAVQIYENALETLKGDWTGAALIAMAAKAASLFLKIRSSFDRVNDAVSELERVKALFYENENKTKAAIESLDVGSASAFQG